MTRHLLETCRVDAWQFTLSPTPMLFIFVHGDFVERMHTAWRRIRREQFS